MGVGIDEAWRNDMALCVDLLAPLLVDLAYRDDPAVRNGDVGLSSGGT
jgi:hypothetical protein